MAPPALRSRFGRLALWAFGLVCFGSGCAPVQGPATNWTLTGQVTERVSADLNRDLDPDGDELLLTNALNAGLVLDAETKRALFRAELGVDARYFVGEDEELAGTGDINPRAAFRGTWRGKTTELSASASATVQEADANEITDTGLSENTTRQITGVVNLRLAERIDARNQISTGFDFRVVDFLDDSTSLIKTRTVSSSFGWQHTLTQTTALTLNLGLRHFQADNTQGTRTQTASISAGLTHRRTPRHTFNLSGGLTGLRSLDRNTDQGTEYNLGFTGAAGLDYQAKTWSAGLGLSQSIEPSSAGALQAFTRLNSNVAYTLNDLERMGLRLTLGRRGSASGDADDETLITADISPSYTWRIAENTSLTLGYSFRMSHDDDGTGLGHRVTLSFGQGFDLVP